MLRIVLSFMAIMIGMLGGSLRAFADCDPRFYLLQDITKSSYSAEMELAFVLTSTEEEFNKVKQSGGMAGGYGLITGSANYDEAREKARKVATATKFDQRESYAGTYFKQNLSSAAVDALKTCLNNDKQSPGLRVWLDRREGDFLFFGAFWVGTDTAQGVGEYDNEPTIAGGTIASKPSAWVKAQNEQILVQREPNKDLLLSLSVGGKSQGIVVVKDPPVARWDESPVVSARLMAATSFGPNPGCKAGIAEDCIYPTKPGGMLEVGSQFIVDHTSTDEVRFSKTFTDLTPERMCVKITQSTGGCEWQEVGKGRLSAREKFPTAD
ncbi:hypothetical protein [Rhizobium leguminosarum]|uniref:hypothetical protein n=1 Tax=Rhizobium leguminosarum TaxID=384 RepID=UPI001C9434CD|nr:hypothetical protein [Rhizobium leguminosarum]MBY5439328.1 hypothetical protein [Rhizobium leguminosarum]